MAETAATRSAALALAGERALMRQGHQFLDEKRMLLAGALLRALREHEALDAELLEAAAAAGAAWRRALQRHGQAGLDAYPPAPPVDGPRTLRESFLGVAQLALVPAPSAAAVDPGRGAGDARMPAGPDGPGLRAGTAGGPPALDASPEAQACCAAFRDLLGPLARLASCRGNLERLAAELRRTQRRARALENVLLPEVESQLAAVQAQLEMADQEEAVRIRLAARRPGPGKMKA
ncbi:MAG: V-type ATP synthase subunit D [Burkholderiales bacterium]|nr:V-type ATP synthase subunit D [Burkholderiales bacterium]